MTYAPRSHHSHSQTSIDNRRRYAARRERQPDEIHDYRPDRRIDHDECAICGRVYDAAVHVPLGPDDPGDV